MKIAYCIREDYQTRGGGDVVQMLMTKSYVEKMDQTLMIEIITDPDLLDTKYDLCHIFNYSTDKKTMSFFEQALRYKIKIASSPIYWDYSVTAYQYFSKLGVYIINRTILDLEVNALTLGRNFSPIYSLTSRKFARACKYFLEHSDVVLPNSKEEYGLLLKFVREQNEDKFYHEVVVNATEVQDTIITKREFLKEYDLPTNYLLQVGRIEPIKNQLSVIKALKDDVAIPIVFLGKIFDVDYYKKVKKLAESRGNVFFVNEVAYRDVFKFYRFAHTHILPSLRESPGLVSLEAYSQGCNIICSEFPFSPYQTYFAKIALPVDPLSLRSIKEAVKGSYKIGKRNTDKGILKSFSWEQAAVTTLKAYKNILL